MTRRDLFRRLSGGLAAAGVAAPLALDAHAAPPDATRTLAVLRFNERISLEMKARIRDCWTEAVRGTAWATVPVLVLDSAASFEAHFCDEVSDQQVAAIAERLAKHIGRHATPSMRFQLGLDK